MLPVAPPASARLAACGACTLILTVKPPPEPEVIQALRQLCPKLSARKQRELMDVIQVMAKPKKRQR
jgi:toxic protein SymE